MGTEEIRRLLGGVGPQGEIVCEDRRAPIREQEERHRRNAPESTRAARYCKPFCVELYVSARMFVPFHVFVAPRHTHTFPVGAVIHGE